MLKWFVPTAMLLFIVHSAFAVTFIPLRGAIALDTAANRRSAVVTISQSNELVAQFCLTFAEPLEQSLRIKTLGEVVYLPKPMEGIAPGERPSGPEPIAQTLTVIPENGTPIAFVAKGVRPIVPKSQIILIRNVSRLDSAVTIHAEQCAAHS